MTTTRHDLFTGPEIHVPYNWTYANATARTGATGFVTADIGKLALQSDTNNLYLLTAVTPTWSLIGGGLVSPMNLPGDLITGGNAGAAQRLGIGTTGQVLNTVAGAPYLAAPAAPVPTTAATGGTIAAGTYTVGVTYVNAQGETVASTSGTVTTSGTTSTITVPSPPASGSGSQAATGWYAYVSQAGLTVLTRQQAAGSPTAIGTALTLTAPPTSTGAAVPGANTAGSLVPGWAAAAAGGAGLWSALVIIVDQKPATTAGGTFTSGAWRTRDINTKLTDTGNNASVATNQITLLAGTYDVDIACPALNVNSHSARLYNITGAAVLLQGQNAYCNLDYIQTNAIIKGTIVLTGTTVLEIQHYSQSSRASLGFGAAGVSGTTEIYTVAEFRKR